MFITTNAVFQIETGEQLQREGYDYEGPLELCCGGGPSQSQQDIASQQAAFFKTMQSSFQTTFAGQQNILAQLQSAWAPVLAAGPGQYGFTAKEDAALRTMSTAGVAQNYKFASQAAGESMAATGGGNTFLPSGAQAQLKSDMASAAAGEQSNLNLGITEAGYSTGRQNFLAASREMGGVASQMNPQGYAGQATAAGNAAYGSAQTNQEMSNAASPWNAVAGVLGGALSSGLGAFTGGIGGGLAKDIMGGGGGGAAPISGGFGLASNFNGNVANL
jgi:hypothetical protein